jgi:hypothetical protein
MPSTSDRLFRIDDDYDRTYASGSGGSRYGNYLADRTRLFVDDDTEQPTTDPAHFADQAFQISLLPVMSPSYVRTHPRILSVDTAWDDDDRFGVVVAFAAPLPASIALAIVATGGRPWRDWDPPCWYEPYELDRPAAYTTVTIRMPIPRDDLPEPAYHRDGAPEVTTAKAAVRVISARVNSHLQPVFAALDPISADRD